VLGEIKSVKAEAVRLRIRGNVLPRNDYKKVQIQPPGEQQDEIQRCPAPALRAVVHVWPDGHGSHERDKMKKEDDVANERIRNLSAQEYLGARPQELCAKPQHRARGD
jgi:hypothetical protein